MWIGLVKPTPCSVQPMQGGRRPPASCLAGVAEPMVEQLA
jgi:hypothetical protein